LPDVLPLDYQASRLCQFPKSKFLWKWKCCGSNYTCCTSLILNCL